MTDKAQAWDLLTRLHEYLDQALAAGPMMQATIDALLDQGQQDPAYKHLCSPEHAFNRALVVPTLHKFLVNVMSLSPDQAREALRAEGYKNFPTLSADTPARSVGHPFDKNLIAQPHTLYQKWARLTARQPLTTSCPDFSFTAPQPIVFEAKYFASGSRYQAEKELAADAYQAFFYQSLPAVSAAAKRSWDYAYSCLLAFDASPDEVLKQAWEDLPTDVRAGFWDGANVYIMILRGNPDLQP